MQKKFGQQGTPLENDWPHYHERLFFQKMPFPNDGIDGTRRIDNFSSDFFMICYCFSNFGEGNP